MSHGLAMIMLLRANMQALGRKPSDVENAAVLEQYLEVNKIKLKRPRKAGMPKPRARDAVFDCIAKIDGQDLTQKMTRSTGSRIAAAKQQILEVLPEHTAEQVVAEIEARWARFCRKYTEPRMRTAMALVGHWGEFRGLDSTERRQTKAELMNIYIEPQGDWRKVGAILMKIDVALYADKQWLDLSPDLRTSILGDMVKNGSLQ